MPRKLLDLYCKLSSIWAEQEQANVIPTHAWAIKSSQRQPAHTALAGPVPYYIIVSCELYLVPGETSVTLYPWRRRQSCLGKGAFYTSLRLVLRYKQRFLAKPVLTEWLTRLRPHSRFGDTLLGNRVRYVFMYSAVVIGVRLTRLRPHPRVLGTHYLEIESDMCLCTVQC